eukprot:m.439610 g.439610  ORF g.439610 m.439610 type:complete len:672 (-) comp18403_c0_seq1:923-2938(-)
MARPTTKAPELDAQMSAVKKARSKKSYGVIKLRVFFDAEVGDLVVQVFEARDLRHVGGWDGQVPYVKMYILPDKNKKTKKKTTPRKGTVNPFWEEEFRWQLTNFQDHIDRCLEISVWNREKVSSNQLFGRTTIQLSKVLPPGEPIEGWFELFDGEVGKKNFNIMKRNGAPSDHYVALYDYNPRCKQELLMRQDDIVILLEEDKDWSLVENAISGTQGYVPATFIAVAFSLESEPWFFGKITRSKAEKLLMNPMRKHGCFLIRESESAPGQYSLSMRDGDSVRHFRVQTLDGGKYRLQGSPSPPFTTLGELVEFHKRKKAGLTTTLKEPCPAEHKPMAPDLSAATRDKWEIDRVEIELTGVLGQGQYGEVYRGKWKGTVDVAVKTMKEDTATSEDFLTELAVMKALKHANLVQLYAVCTIGSPLFIITELMPQGALLDYLRKPEGEALRLPTLVDMAADCANGMSHIESHGYIHRDLAARNILVGADNICKVADFGFARLLDDSGQFQAAKLEKFPVRWTAPEAMAYNKYSIKSDVWSFGVLVAEIVTYGKKPYLGLSNKEVVSKIDEGYRMEKPQGCPEGLYNIMLDCWKTEPMDRPTFESLVYRLEDFFHSGEANYTDPSKFVDESEKPSELPSTIKKEQVRLTQPDGGEDSDEGGGGGGAAAASGPDKS